MTGIDTDALGLAAMRLGGGRAQKDDQLDLAVGLVLHKKLGTPVSVGDTLATLHTDSQDTSAIEQAVQRAFTIGQSAPAKFQLIKKVIQG